MLKNRFGYYISTIFILICYQTLKAVDELAVIIVVDQLAHNAFQHVKPYLQGGMKTILKNGITYENAHFPYAATATGPGHACLNTGTTPKDNGIIKNSWFDKNNIKIDCETGSVENAAVFKADGTCYDFGKSAAQIKVDGISDQLILANNPNAQNKVFSISIKARAAVCSAGELGKAFWFDEKTGNLTTSKAYHAALPNWLINFNKKNAPGKKNRFEWQLHYEKNNPAYSFIPANSYTQFPSIIGKPLDINTFSTMYSSELYAIYSRLPESNKLVFEAAKECLLDAQAENPKKVLLWICLSSLDKVGHMYGPNSFEYIDTIYHIDTYLQDFMEWIKNNYTNTKTLFALTADHGSAPIPEQLQQEGFNLARRIDQKELRKKINNLIQEKHSISDIIAHINTLSLYLDKKKLSILEPKVKTKVLADIKHYLQKQPGFKNAWTFHELENCPVQKHDIRNYFKNSLFAGRSGEIQYQLDPYCFVTKHPSRTCHSSPYDYTTHVPLILYQSDFTQQRIIEKPVEMTQLAPTLARFFSVNTPSACLYPPLPEFKRCIDTSQATR